MSLIQLLVILKQEREKAMSSASLVRVSWVEIPSKSGAACGVLPLHQWFVYCCGGGLPPSNMILTS